MSPQACAGCAGVAPFVPAQPAVSGAIPRRRFHRCRLARLFCGATGACLAYLAGTARHEGFVEWAEVQPRLCSRIGRRAAPAGRDNIAVSPKPIELKVKERPRGEKLKIVTPRSWLEKPKPPTLPPGLFKPKESLSQRFLADPNYIYKMVEAVDDDSPGGRRLLELGPGTGALTTRLHARYPDMFAIELDQRAMRVLAAKVPGVTCIRSDALLVNYTKLAEIRGGPLTITGNMPYHVVTQIMFALADQANAVNKVTTTMQKEVADRILAKPRTKAYGIPSVCFQLYSNPRKLFDLPPTAFFPRPNVMSTTLEFDFAAAKERRAQLGVNPRDLRNLTQMAFNQRNKKLHNSLTRLLNCHTTLINELPPEYTNARPAHLEPWEFAHLTQLVFGKKEFPQHHYRAWRGEFGRRVRD